MIAARECSRSIVCCETAEGRASGVSGGGVMPLPVEAGDACRGHVQR